MTGTIAFGILVIISVIIFILGRTGRSTPLVLSWALLLLIMYLATKLVHGLVMMLTGSLPWWAALPLIVAVLYGALVRGAMNILATNYEGCSNPRERFTGSGLLGYRFGNLFLVVLIGLGAMGMTNFAPISELWVFLSSAIGTVVCLTVHHQGDHELASQLYPSNSAPTKLYHDFVIWGLFIALHLTTWVPALAQTVLAAIFG